ncbi:hypothetical protein AAC387_Pa05g0683 [Persea americana]
MPPSPALRFSPARQLRTQKHRRGRSLEGGLKLKERDDSLALFNDIQARKGEIFLLQSIDDLDESLSKLRYFPDFKLGISAPFRRGSSDLLNADGGKSDYDWLLTPPDTPLFPSLDDDTPLINLVQRGRPQNQAIPIPRRANREKDYRTGRSSASPRRLSPSPRSGSNTFQSRGRPSSAPCSTPSPVLHPTTPSRRPSTPSNKHSSLAPRCSLPALRRMSTGSSVQPFRGRGISPGKLRRASSASPRLQGWQLSLSGFSSDPPPNLRTSLSDSPPSHIRGISPASRNGNDSYSKFGRQSMSPTASTVANSSHCYGRGHFHLQSKGSAASSGDDHMDSLQPIIVSDHLTSRNNGVFPSRKAVKLLKKPSRTISASSALKRSFDSAIRKKDQRKSPQHSFRQLLSSVPTTTLYVSENTTHSPKASRNSSVTTSSGANSEQGARVAPDDMASDYEQDDMVKEWGKAPCPDTQEEIIIHDKVDEIDDDIEHGICNGEPNGVHESFEQSTADEVQPRECENLNRRHAAAADDATASESSHVEEDSSDVDFYEMMGSCSNCGNNSLHMESMDGNATICWDCTKSGLLTTRTSKETAFVTKSNAIHSKVTLGENVMYELEPVISPLKLSEETCYHAMFGKQERNGEQGHDCLQDNCIARLVVEEGEKLLVDHHFVGNQEILSSQSQTDAVDQQLRQFYYHLSTNVDNSEAGGISVLLKPSGSSKWSAVQGREFTARKICCDDPSYPRDCLTTKKSCIGHGSDSTSSSVDLDLARQVKVQVQCQLSSQKADMGSSGDDSDARPVTRTSFSGTPKNSSEALAYAKNLSEEDIDDSVGNLKYMALEYATFVMDRESCDLVNADKQSFFISTTVSEDYKHDDTDRVTNASGLDGCESSSHTQVVQLVDASAARFPNDDDPVFSGKAKVLSNNKMSFSDIEIQVMTAESFITEEDHMYGHVCAVGDSDAPMCASSLVIVGEIQDGLENIATSQIDCTASPDSKDAVDVFLEPTVSLTLENNTLVSTLKFDVSDFAHDVNGDMATVEHPGEQKVRMRSLRLDEANDSILFCSSIVQSLAYQAAIIAMEKEDFIYLKGSQPTVTILDQSDFISKNQWGRTLGGQQRQWEIEHAFPSKSTENNVKVQESLTYIAVNPDKVDTVKPPKLESKCNCTVM